MPQMIFVNLPVADLRRSVEFYEAIGFSLDPRFSNDQAATIQPDRGTTDLRLSFARGDGFESLVPRLSTPVVSSVMSSTPWSAANRRRRLPANHFAPANRIAITLTPHRFAPSSLFVGIPSRLSLVEHLPPPGMQAML